MTEIGSGSEEVEKYEYYKDGTLAKTISPSGKEIDYTYDKWGNLTRIDHDGEVNVKRTYDEYGQLLRTEDSTGSTAYQWDIAGRLTSVAGGGRTLGYEYDTYGNLTDLIYPDNSRVEYTYDARNRMASMVERDGTKVTYEYDANDNLLSEKRSDGIQTTNTYDSMDRTTLTETVKAGGTLSSFAYTYDRSGRMVKEKAEDALGIINKSYVYSEDGKLNRYEEMSGDTWLKTIDYAYDTFGNKTKESTKEAGKPIQTVNYTYDSSDRLKTKSENGTQTGSYTYDKDGNLTKKSENGTVTEYTYTIDNRMATTTVNGVLENAVTYDGNGLKTFELLRKEYQKTVTDEDYALIKDNGKLLEEWQTYHRYVKTEDITVIPGEEGSEASTYTVDNGRNYNPTVFYIAYAVGGIMPTLWEEWYDFACTFFEDLKEVFTIPGIPGREEEAELATNRQSREMANLIEEVTEPTSRWITTSSSHQETVSYYEPTSYLYDMTRDNAQVLAEYAKTATNQAKETYTYGASGRSSAATTGVYIYDGRGSVSETVKGGKVTSTLRYDPYGTITYGAPAQNRIYAYNGEQYTPQTGLVYLRARNYDPATGTFTSRDTYLGDQTNPVSRNRYTYANNNPVMYQDPSGHAGLFSKIVSAVKNTVKTVVKTVTKVVKSVVNKVTTSSSKSSSSTNTTKKTTQKTTTTSSTTKKTTTQSTSSKNTRPVVNAAKEVINKAIAVVNNATKTGSSSSSNRTSSQVINTYRSGGDTTSSTGTNTGFVQNVKQTVSRYISSKVKEVKQDIAQAWENTKDVIEGGLSLIIKCEEGITHAIQAVDTWWKELGVTEQIYERSEKYHTAWKNSSIGMQVTALAEKTNSAGRWLDDAWNNSSVAKWCENTKNSVTQFYEENKTAIHIAGGVVVAAGAVAAVVYFGEAALAILAQATTTGLKYAGAGAIIGGALGSAGSAYGYMKEHGTIDGSTDEILSGLKEGGIIGAEIGFSIGFGKGASDYLKSPAVIKRGTGSGVTFKSQYEIPTNEKGYTKSSLELGKKVHKEYMSDVADDVNKIKEYVLPSGKRVDFIDFVNKIVYELKPNNPNQIKKGIKQLAGYLEEIETVFGEGWSSVLDTY